VSGNGPPPYLALGRGQNLTVIKEIFFPHFLGSCTRGSRNYIGFKVNSGEYKVMSLAPYGTDKYMNRIREHLIDIKPEGSFRLNMEYFDYCTGLDDDR
jgi:carbamoyltransferase